MLQADGHTCLDCIILSSMKTWNALSSANCSVKQQMILTLNVTEKVGADEGEHEHWDRQGAVRQHLPHFGMQERTERQRETEREGEKEKERGREMEEEGMNRERQIIEEYNYCGQDKDNGCNPDTV